MQHDAATFERYEFPGGYSPWKTRGDCAYDVRAAQQAIDFFPRFLVHIKGELAGKPLYLEPWQAAIVASIFGWKRPDGTRRFRVVYIEVPRKNGKSTLSAGVALLFLYLDDEPGAEIYSAAADADQAAIVFELAKENVLRQRALEKRSKVYRRSITSYDGGGLPRAAYKVLSSDAHTKHGYNPSVIIADELHAHESRELWDVLNTGTGARRQPLTVAITTSGFDKHTICYEQHEYAEKVIDGLEDGAFLPVIYAAGKDDDWRQEATWRKANPNFGVSVSADYLARECQRAQETPSYENTFKRLHLDVWTEQDVRWLAMDDWDQCAGAAPLDSLDGKTCFAGLDLSTTTDVSALSLVFPDGEGGYDLLPYFWIPADSIVKRSRRDRVPYDAWQNQGLVCATPGNIVDYSLIRAKLNELNERFHIATVAVDPWNATQVMTWLDGDGFEVAKCGQGFASMSAPTKELERLVLSRQLRHGGNRPLRWMAQNVTIETDAAGNMKPSKKKSTERIDGMVATIMAIGAAMESEGDMIYNRRGLIVL